MTLIRTARPGELHRLAAVEGEDERNAVKAEYLLELLRRRRTRPEWCLVAEDAGGRVVGSIVLLGLPHTEVPYGFRLFEAPWDEPGLATARALLAHAAGIARRMGSRRLVHELLGPPCPPEYQVHVEARHALLAELGTMFGVDEHRFRWTSATPVPRQDPRLTWRAFAELGEVPFLRVIAAVLVDTVDPRLRDHAANGGPVGAAKRVWADMRFWPSKPHWAEIGYDETGTPVAVSVPIVGRSHPTLGLIGVASRHRGKGYGAAATARGTSVLAQEGAAEVRGDCFAGNDGMRRTFRSCGYGEVGTVRTFTVDCEALSRR